MERKHFLGMMGGVPFLTGLSSPNLSERDRETSETLIGTTERRSRYIMRLLDQLCIDIGPRPIGSVASQKAAQILKREMERSLPHVELDEFQLKGWELIDEPELWLDLQRIEAWPAQGSESTPPTGVTGRLERQEHGWFLVDSYNGEPKALLTVSQYGKAIPSFQRPQDPPVIPNIGIGRQDVPLLEKAELERVKVHLKAWSRFNPQAAGVNVVGRIPGRSRNEILFVAHSDSVYTSPGAHDNMASVLIMIMLAHAASDRRWNHTLTFVAMDGEEYGYQGAWNYARRRSSEQSMSDIRYVVNFDSLTYGPNLWINSHDEGLRELIRSIHVDLGIDTTPRFEDSDGYSMDSLPFRPSGARAMHVNSRGYDEKTLPLWHRREDLPMEIPLDCVDIAFRVFFEYLRRVDEA